MGCCPSTPSNPTSLPYSTSNLAARPADRSPPMPPQDDVKVLTETPPSKCPAFDPINLVMDRRFCQPKQLESDRNSKPRVQSLLPLPLPAEDRASEICRRSDRFVSTANDDSSSGAIPRTTASKNDGRRSNRSHSPSKKPDARMQSPGSLASAARRNVRRTQDQSPGCRAPARVVDGPKADLGERSGRRSRSPAKRVGRIEPGRRTDPSPGRSRRLNPPKGEELLIGNPPVSLECFIFL